MPQHESTQNSKVGKVSQNGKKKMSTFQSTHTHLPKFTVGWSTETLVEACYETVTYCA
jgi:hypothetical protein